MQHIKKLDSLRAVAAILVILWHWLPAGSVINTLNNGAIGVNTFFVLSGFLITRILLHNRNEAESQNNSKAAVLKTFYIRRALRIFPIYYLLVFLILFCHKFVGAKLGRAEFLSSITYTINFHFFKFKYWGYLTTHFWSLAVEEQFYLFWPFVILFVKRKYLIHAILLFIFTGVLSQCLIQDFRFGYLPTYTCFDAFGLGALLSWIIVFRPLLLNRFYTVISVLATVSFIILLAQISLGDLPYFPQRTMHSFIALWMIAYIVLNKGKSRFSFSALIDNRCLFFLGKISYGIYLYHIPMQWIGYRLSPLLTKYFPFHFVVQHSVYFVLALDFCLLIFISWLSFRFIEKPILKLKDYFDYQLPKQRDARTSNKNLSTRKIIITE